MQKSLRKKILGSIFLLFCSFSFAHAQGEIQFQEDFEDGSGAGWNLEPGWVIIQEGDNYALQGEGPDWARLERDFPKDFRLTFRAKLIQGRLHLITHHNDQGRYFSGISANNTSISKQYWPDTFQENLASSRNPLPGNTWLDIELISERDTLKLKVNGQEQWTFSDPEKFEGGGIAFETLEGSLVQVDDLLVYYLGESSQEEPPPEQEPAQTTDPTNWIRTGGPLGGLGYDVRMHPDNPDKMYVTDAFGGVFISEDAGKTWYPSNQGLTDRTGDSQDAIPVFCLTIDPHNPDIIWTGTQFSGGLFKSVDGGKSWSQKTSGVSNQNGLTFRGITVDPVIPEIVYAAGEISSWSWAGQPLNGREFDLTKGVVYKSINGGENWREVWRGDNLARYIWINPHDNNVIYVSTGIFDREAANSDPVSGNPGGVGVIKSTDGGENWFEVNNGLDNLYVGSLFMHPENPEILLAGTGHNQYWENNGVYLTTDGANSWTRVFNGERININSVEFSTTNPQVAYAGGESIILRSEDGGNTWSTISPDGDGWGAPGVRGGFPIDFQVDPRDPMRIFANNYGGGNFLSENGGENWQVASSGYTGAQIRAIAVDPNYPGVVFVAARSGIFVSRDGGSTWSGITTPPFMVLEWNAIAVNPANPTSVLTATNWNPILLHSSNSGQSWQNVLELNQNLGVRVLAFAPSDPNWVYAGTGGFISAGVFDPEVAGEGIYQSRDGGENWERNTTESFSDAHVADISVAAGDHQTVFAATTNYGIIRTRNSGEKWEQINQGLMLRHGARSVAVHPGNPEIVYAGISFGGIYRSDNSGDSWQQSSAGLNPEANISDIVIDPTNPNNLYTSDLFSGVYRSVDGGKTWQLFSEGLRMRAVYQLALSQDGAHLYAATEGEGVYRRDLNGYPPQGMEIELETSGEMTPEELEVQEAAEEPLEEESQEAEHQEAEPQESSPGRQVCPGSYLPLVVGLAGYQIWTTRKSSMRRK